MSSNDDEEIKTPPSTGSAPEIVTRVVDDTPTASHVLAEESIDSEASHTAKGLSQRSHEEADVVDLSWKTADAWRDAVIGGVDNETLNTLLRRFDKQIYCVRSIAGAPLTGLDMNVADDEEFSPEKLRAQFERFYMLIGVSLYSAMKQLERLRSWREWRRTAVSLCVYVVAWAADMLMVTLITFLLIVVLWPQARDICFPTAPPSVVRPPRGVDKGQLEGQAEATEESSDRAVEAEAHGFINGISMLLLRSAAGEQSHDDADKDNAVVDPTQLTEKMIFANPNAQHDAAATATKKTNDAMADKVWVKARPAMHAMSNVMDTWERFANALSATAPFPKMRPRMPIAGCLLLNLVGSYYATSYMVLKVLGFVVGFAFYGQPIFRISIRSIDLRFPHWRKHIQLRHNILRQVPTNAQLTTTLLRVGERNKAPLPPPSTKNTSAQQTKDHVQQEDGKEKGQHDDAEGRDKDENAPKSSSMVGFFKTTTAGLFEITVAFDSVKAFVGNAAALDRLGVIQGPYPNPPTGTVEFPARYHGSKGHAYITSTATTPALSWTTDLTALMPAWTIMISDIDELRKVGGLSWKSKVIVGWALEKEVVDGLLVRTRDGQEKLLTAVIKREELFNRIVGMSTQVWEVC